jgi:hypothetical protein
MNADEENALTEHVIGAILEVSNTLGAGFLKKGHRVVWRWRISGTFGRLAAYR